VLTDGSVEIDVPRDRNGTFERQIVPKGETRLDGFDDKIISLYARGMTVREIQGHLRELYAVDVSPDLISRVPTQPLPHDLALRSPPGIADASPDGSPKPPLSGLSIYFFGLTVSPIPSLQNRPQSPSGAERRTLGIYGG
jgi:hypothetical protein